LAVSGRFLASGTMALTQVAPLRTRGSRSARAWRGGSFYQASPR
jgi:hypothetical protein